MPDRAGAAHASPAANRPPSISGCPRPTRSTPCGACIASGASRRRRRSPTSAGSVLRHDASVDRPGGDARSASACRSPTPTAITSTHRGHGHCIAKGARARADVRRVPRQARPAIARGAAARCISPIPAKGNLGANGIVGGGLPIAVGAALSAKKRRSGAVAVAFFGDGANNEGAFHESLNIASVWKLPVVFVCENNQYAMSTAIARSTAVVERRRSRQRLCDAGRHRRRQRFRRGRGSLASRRSTARAPAKARR